MLFISPTPLLPLLFEMYVYMDVCICVCVGGHVCIHVVTHDVMWECVYLSELVSRLEDSFVVSILSLQSSGLCVWDLHSGCCEETAYQELNSRHQACSPSASTHWANLSILPLFLNIHCWYVDMLVTVTHRQKLIGSTYHTLYHVE